jgi:hypothetical protein
MRGRVVTSQVRTIAVLAVALLVLAPTVVRALQSLDCGPSSTGLTFSRSSPAPPLRTQVLPPVAAILGTPHPDGSDIPDVTSRARWSDEVVLVTVCAAAPDLTRGPPNFSLY